MAIKIGSTTVITSGRAATFTTITGSSIDVSGNSDANQFRINGTAVINSSRNLVSIGSIAASSIDVSGNSDANQFRINGTAVVNSSRNLTGLGSSSGALALSGDNARTLTLTIGGTSQDTQALGSAFAVKKLAVYSSASTGTVSVDLTNSTSVLVDYYGRALAGCGFSRWARCSSNGTFNVTGSCWRGVNLGDGTSFRDEIFCSSGADVDFNIYRVAAVVGSHFDFQVKFTDSNTMKWSLVQTGAATSSITVITF